MFDNFAFFLEFMNTSEVFKASVELLQVLEVLWKKKDQRAEDEQKAYSLKCFSLHKYLKSVSTITSRKCSRKENFTHIMLFRLILGQLVYLRRSKTIWNKQVIPLKEYL